MSNPRHTAVNLALLALAVLSIVWALYAQTIAIPRNRARAREFLAIPNVEVAEIMRYSSDARVSVSGALHREGAATGDWIAYVESRKDPYTRASAPSEQRWVIARIERPKQLQLQTSSGALRLVPSIEEYPLIAGTSSKSGDTSKLGFQDGQRVTVFGRIQSYGTDGSPETFAFDEIWGKDWAEIQQPYQSIAESRTSPGVIFLVLLGLGLGAAFWWRRRASPCPSN